MPPHKGISNNYQFPIITNFQSIIGHLKLEIRNLKFRSGYTLVELLVVLGLLALVVGSVLLFLTSILRGTNQTNISAEVKQNGQAVLDSLERQIRGAKSATQIPPASLPGSQAASGISLANPDGSTLYVVCFNSVPSGPSAANGYIGTTTQVPGTNQNDYKTITNTDLVSGINVSSCSLSTVLGSTLSADVVVISFVADRAIRAPQRADFNASAQFQTTISLRKY